MSELVEAWVDSVPGLRARLEAGCDVLELECGSGELSIALKQRFPRARVLGFDRSDRRIAFARCAARAQGLSGIHFATLDWTHGTVYGFPVVLTQVGRVPAQDREALAKAVRRALRAGGVHLEIDGLWPAADGHAA
jgi:SAM-dependent methyltransferase